jgi:hypothetical protein
MRILLVSVALVGCSQAPAAAPPDTDSHRLERGALLLAPGDPNHTLRIVRGPFVLTDLEVNASRSVLYTSPVDGSGDEGCPAAALPEHPKMFVSTSPIVPVPEKAQRVRVNAAPLHGGRYLIHRDEVLCIVDVVSLAGSMDHPGWVGSDLSGNWAGFRPR